MILKMKIVIKKLLFLWVFVGSAVMGDGRNNDCTRYKTGLLIEPFSLIVQGDKFFDLGNDVMAASSYAEFATIIYGLKTPNELAHDGGLVSALLMNIATNGVSCTAEGGNSVCVHCIFQEHCKIFRLGDIYGVIKKTSKIIENHPNHLIFFLRSLAYIKSEQHTVNDGLSDLNNSIQANPNFLPAYLMRGLFYQQIGMNDEALSDYSKFIDQCPEILIARFYRGKLLYKLNRWAEALEDFNRIAAIRPDVGIGNVHRARIFEKRGEYEKAIKEYSYMLEKSFNEMELSRVEMYTARAMLYLYDGKFDSASEDLQHIYAMGVLSPDISSRADTVSTLMFHKLGDYNKALFYIERAIKNAPNDTRLEVLRSKIVQEQEQKKENN